MPLDRPIFVIGCGRAGTTLLGRALAAHRDIGYLNEPRKLWLQAFPEGDIWTPGALEHGGRIRLDETSHTPQAASLLTRLFAEALEAGGRSRLCEKLPINAFRLELIKSIFPDARFVYIERHGASVAASIAREIDAGRWLGPQELKWRGLLNLAAAEPGLEMARDCATSFHRGLLEFVLSTLAARRALAAVPRRVTSLWYFGLGTRPTALAQRIETVCDLAPTGEIAAYLRDTVREDRTPPVFPDDFSRELLAARGRILTAARLLMPGRVAAPA